MYLACRKVDFNISGCRRAQKDKVIELIFCSKFGFTEKNAFPPLSSEKTVSMFHIILGCLQSPACQWNYIFGCRNFSPAYDCNSSYFPIEILQIQGLVTNALMFCEQGAYVVLFIDVWIDEFN